MQWFWPIWKDLWGIVGVAVLIVLLIEAGAKPLRGLGRLVRGKRVKSPDYRALAEIYEGQDWAVRYFEELFGRGRVNWEPFVQWWQHPLDGEFIHIDAKGLRRTVAPPPARTPAVRLHMFGGSTMMGVGVRDEWTLPSIMARRLHELGYAVEVTNYGQLGHSSTQEMISLIRRVRRGDIPDIALFLDGVNEVIGPEQTGTADSMFHEDHRRSEFNILHEYRRRDLIVAGLLALVPRTVRRIRDLGGVDLRRLFPSWKAVPPKMDAVPALCDDIVATYAENVRIIHSLAHEFGFRPLCFWQPFLLTRRHMSPHEARHRFDGAPDPEVRNALFLGVLERRKKREDLRERTIDIGGLFDDDPNPVYFDPFHVSERANVTIVEAMLPHVRTVLDGLAAKKAT